jgi:bilin biosynthesis protein
MALSEGNFSIRSSASLALGKLGNKRAVEPLIRGLGSENSIVRESSVLLLIEIGDGRAVEPLIKYLKTNTGVKPETPGNMT